MPTLRRMLVVGVSAWLIAPTVAGAQPVPYNLKYDSGQTVQPIFEGWSRSPDGSFTMHFGYLNRNWVEEVHVPVGVNNRFEPGDIDAGQPTFFYPRVHRRQFSVPVPADFGDGQLVWSLTTRGQTLQAVGWLEPTWEIDPIHMGRSLDAEELENIAPVMDVEVPGVVLPGERTTLIARVTDDGLPTPPDPDAGSSRPIGQESPPTLQEPEDAPEFPNNVPSVSERGDQPRVRGLRVSWEVWRGPAGVSFTPASTVAVTDGQAAVDATFAVPGEYVLRAEANDGSLTTLTETTVNVRAPAQN